MTFWLFSLIICVILANWLRRQIAILDALEDAAKKRSTRKNGHGSDRALKGILIFASLLLFSQSAQAQVSYSVYDLGTLPGGTLSYGSDLNNSGQVTGYSYMTGGYVGGFLATVSTGGAVTMTNIGAPSGSVNTYGALINNAGQVAGYSLYAGPVYDVIRADTSSGIVTNIGTLGGMYGNPSGINSSGQMTGSSTDTSGRNQAFLATVGTAGAVTMTNLGDLPGGSFSFGAALNDSGQVTGESMTTSGQYHAFLASVGTGGAVSMVDLGTIGGTTSDASWGTAINNAGQVTGYADTAAGNRDAFLASVGTGGAVTMVDLGTLGGGFGEGVAINASGQVIGNSSLSTGWYHGFIASVGTGGAVTMIDLGTLGDPASGALAINASGDVLGYDQTSSGTTADYFLYDTSYTNPTYGNHLLDLTTLLTASGWSNISVVALNDSDQLTGSGNIGGQHDAFLLDLNVVAVPEPSTYGACALGLILAFGLVHRRLKLRDVIPRGFQV